MRQWWEVRRDYQLLFSIPQKKNSSLEAMVGEITSWAETQTHIVGAIKGRCVHKKKGGAHPSDPMHFLKLIK